MLNPSTLSCLVAANSAEAAQNVLRIAETVSESRRVLFVDLQISACPRKGGDLLYGRLSLADLDPADPEKLFAEIEEAVTKSGAQVCVIDSLFYLCEWRDKARSTRFFILRLRELSRRLGIAVLIGANARKRIAKNASPTAEHLPKGTAPFIDQIVDPQPEPEPGEGAPEVPESVAAVAAAPEVSEEVPALAAAPKKSPKIPRYLATPRPLLRSRKR